MNLLESFAGTLAALYVVAFGLLSARIAVHKGRRWLLWFALGATLSIPALLVLLRLPPTAEHQLEGLGAGKSRPGGRGASRPG